jgi:hypothetical protein
VGSVLFFETSELNLWMHGWCSGESMESVTSDSRSFVGHPNCLLENGLVSGEQNPVSTCMVSKVLLSTQVVKHLPNRH